MQSINKALNMGLKHSVGTRTREERKRIKRIVKGSLRRQKKRLEKHFSRERDHDHFPDRW